MLFTCAGMSCQVNGNGAARFCSVEEEQGKIRGRVGGLDNSRGIAYAG